MEKSNIYSKISEIVFLTFYGSKQQYIVIIFSHDH